MKNLCDCVSLQRQDWHAALAIVTSAGDLDWNKKRFPLICPAAGKPQTGLIYAANDLVGETAGAQRTWGCYAKPAFSDGAGVSVWRLNGWGFVCVCMFLFIHVCAKLNQRCKATSDFSLLYFLLYDIAVGETLVNVSEL